MRVTITVSTERTGRIRCPTCRRRRIGHMLAVVVGEGGFGEGITGAALCAECANASAGLVGPLPDGSGFFVGTVGDRPNPEPILVDGVPVDPRDGSVIP